MLEKVDINSITQILREKGFIDNTALELPNKSGTTDGLVYMLTEHNEAKYVVKIDHPQQIALTEQFLHTYRHINLVPDVLYTDPEKAFIVYAYIPGTTHYNRGSKIKWLAILVKELFNHYERYIQPKQWGSLEKPVRTWREWNVRSLVDTRNHWGSLLSIEDYKKVESIVKRISKNEGNEAGFLLHGDTGVHNFVFHELSLVGVIDPSPMIGPLLYDFTYAFCSSPDDLDLETLLAAFALLGHEPIDRSRLIEEVIFQLYCRIGICLKWHPQDLESYLSAWAYWKNLSIKL
ncbi:phosphotransferase [Paenibacillus agricola]|uniref:Phosphotransferase n=1 Tax=Paenibacillus agricola TaxID=2716264 RepID=A0ABX0IYP4_9BACL|nr:phosphotransferase [Paenibacillus agricola]NHN28997.1 phosphotransferase [Paenibacillus agricola]